MLKSYRELVVWQKAFQLCTHVYDLTKRFPPEERYGLTTQIRRAAVSIPSNIAEGYSRNTKRDYLHFLWMANGSLAEIETQLLLAIELRFGRKEDLDAAVERVREIDRILKSLLRSLQATTRR